MPNSSHCRLLPTWIPPRRRMAPLKRSWSCLVALALVVVIGCRSTVDDSSIADIESATQLAEVFNSAPADQAQLILLLSPT